MSEYVVTNTELTAVANAIRTKGGTSADLEWNADFISAINAISGGGEGAKNILGGITEPTSADGSNGDIYIKYRDYDPLPSGYTQLEYISTGGTAGAFINTGVKATSTAYFELAMKYNAISPTPSFIFGANNYVGGITQVGAYGGNWNAYAGNAGYDTKPLDTDEHVWRFDSSGLYMDDELVSSVGSGFPTTYDYYLFWRQQQTGADYKTTNASIFYCKIWNGDTLVRNLIPAKRDSDDVVGMYDTVNDVFYTNAGTQLFIAGIETNGTPIDKVYLKVNNSWIIIENCDFADVKTEGGNGKNILIGTNAPTALDGVDGDIYLKYGLPAEYEEIEYITFSGNKYIMIDSLPSHHSIKAIATPNVSVNGTFKVCGYGVSGNTNDNDFNSGFVVSSGAVSQVDTWKRNTTYTPQSTYSLSDGKYIFDIERVPISNYKKVYVASYNLDTSQMFKGNIYRVTIKNIDTNETVVDLIPCKRKSDNVYGFFDLFSLVFYEGTGSGTLSGGESVSDTNDNVSKVYCKVNGAWQSLIGQDIDDVNTGE